MHLYGAVFQTLNKDSSHITGKFCGENLPSSILVGSSSIQLRFISDATDYATGFNLTYKALKPNYLPGIKTIYFHCSLLGPLQKFWHQRSWVRGRNPLPAPRSAGSVMEKAY